LLSWDSTYVEDCRATTDQWNRLSATGYSTAFCYCDDSDSTCDAELGSDVIDPNVQDLPGQKRQRFGLVPPSNPSCAHNTCGMTWDGTNYRDAYFESKSSFVNTALKEGLTRDEMVTECYYPTSTRTISLFRQKEEGESSYNYWDLTEEQYGASHYGFTPPNITVGVSLEVVELEVVSCVMEKLVNRIAEGGWEFIPSPTVDTLYFRRQKV